MKFLTTAIFVAFKSERIIENSIKKIKNKAKIIIIENSGNKKLKKLEKKYKDLKVIINDNRGFGSAANLGAKLTKTKYIIFISPDIILKEDGIKKIEDEAKKLKDNFGILLPIDIKNKLKKIEKNSTPDGSGIMFFEKEKFIKYGGFDENFFLYYEDTDLQKRFIEREQKIINIKVYFKHLYGSHNKKFNFEIEINRNWHYMWSRFFFMKKNYNYLFAFIFTFPTFVRSLIKVILYYFINKKKYFIYKGRFLGLINSYLGKKSWHRAL